MSFIFCGSINLFFLNKTYMYKLSHLYGDDEKVVEIGFDTVKDMEDYLKELAGLYKSKIISRTLDPTGRYLNYHLITSSLMPKSDGAPIEHVEYDPADYDDLELDFTPIVPVPPEPLEPPMKPEPIIPIAPVIPPGGEPKLPQGVKPVNPLLTTAKGQRVVPPGAPEVPPMKPVVPPGGLKYPSPKVNPFLRPYVPEEPPMPPKELLDLVQPGKPLIISPKMKPVIPPGGVKKLPPGVKAVDPFSTPDIPESELVIPPGAPKPAPKASKTTGGKYWF